MQPLIRKKAESRRRVDDLGLCGIGDVGKALNALVELVAVAVEHSRLRAACEHQQIVARRTEHHVLQLIAAHPHTVLAGLLAFNKVLIAIYDSRLVILIIDY